MSSPLAAADVVCRIRDAAQALESIAEPLGVPPLAEQEWHRTLVDKLLPQLSDSPYLVVAVVGGTNIGKSLIFNHIVGEKVSQSSATASGTKHPVVVIPETFQESHDLDAIFRSFHVTRWSDASQALAEGSEDVLYWRTSSVMPDNLLVLDTPDIDSDARINWQRADRIRRAADVLVCVLTNQKYNDAAVRQFFKKAADEGQLVIVVFNQLSLPDDEDDWPGWLTTFCDATDLSPLRLYLAETNKLAAAELSVPFLLRSWPPSGDAERSERSLLTDLSELHFEEIKLQTLQGGLHQVADNVPDYLQLVRQRSEVLKRVETRVINDLAAANRSGWPTVPGEVLRMSVKRWWSAQRTGWVRNVSNVYGSLSDGVDAGIRGVRTLVGNPKQDPWTVYREKEWSEGILATVEQLFTALESLQETGPEGVSNRVGEILKSTNRADLLQKLKAAHENIDLGNELEAIVQSEMNRFKTENASAHDVLKKLDTVAAAARPAITAGLFLVGAGPLVEVGVAGTALHLAADAAGGTATTVVGEKLLGEGAGRAFSTLQDWFHGLQRKFVASRADWLRGQLEHRMLGDLPSVLARAAAITESTEYAELNNAHAELVTLLDE